MNIMQEEEPGSVRGHACTMDDQPPQSTIPWAAPSIPWIHMKRQLRPGDPFFEDGNLFYSVNVKELSTVVYEELKTNFA